MKAELVSLECIFLHDTQMADLEREQAALRAMADQGTKHDGSGWIPAAFAQAFCPLAPVRPGSGKMTVGAPEARDGWIIRPVSFERPAAAQADSGTASAASMAVRLPVVTPFPPLPAVPGFILGFADQEHPERAGELAERLAERLRTESPARAFTVNVWYEATLTLEIVLDDGRSYGVFSSIGKPSWKKLTPFSSI
jgi:hypothetical protein